MIKIKNKIEFENNLWVGEIDASFVNSSQEERIKFVTDIASVTLGRLGQNYKSNEIKRRLNLYNKLITEAAGKASTPFEFIPVKIKYSDVMEYVYKLIGFGIEDTTLFFLNKIAKYSYTIHEDTLYLLTNMRTLLNAGIKEEDIPFNKPEELKGFKIIIGKLPKIAFDHLLTHDKIKPRRIAESSRNRKYLNEVEFWYPSNWTNTTLNKIKESDDEKLSKLSYIMNNDFANLKAEEATKELSCRRLMLCAFKGWLQDENGWINLIKQREVKHTQAITSKIVEQIKKLIV